MSDETKPQNEEQQEPTSPEGGAQPEGGAEGAAAQPEAEASGNEGAPAEEGAEAAPAGDGDEKLSKDEIDALLRGVEDGDVAAGDGVDAPDGVRPYDLVGEDRFVGQRFPAIELAQDRLARSLPQSLAAFAGSPPEVAVGKPELLRYGTFRNRLDTPASLHLFTMTPLRGSGVVVLSPQLAFGIVDRFFGGPGSLPEDLGGRTSSPIELQMLQRLVSVVLSDLAAAWAPLHKIAFAFARSESSLASVALTGISDLVLMLPVQCDTGTGPAPLTIVIPFPALEPLKAKLGEPRAASGGGPDGEWRRVVTSVVHDANVTVTAELGTKDFSARQVLGWQAGDVLGLEGASDDPLSLCVEGVPLLTGVPGVSRGSNAVRILGRSE